MSVLFANVTALTMDPARPVVENAFVAVEGTKIVSVGTVRPEAPLTGWWRARVRCSCPAL